jgi:uncharacterized protein
MHPYQHPLFVNFIVYFNENQDYFECHEVLEEYWKSLPNGNKEHPLTAYILLATGMYHWRRGNATGAIRTIRKAMNKFQAFGTQHPSYTQEINMHCLIRDVKNVVNRLENELPFESFPIVVSSHTLTALVAQMVSSMKLLPFGSDAVIHKHMLRDRSDIPIKRNKSASDSVSPDKRSKE